MNQEVGLDAETGALPPPNKIICACANFDFARLEQAVAKLQNHSFDTLLKETGAGRTCTACLLDLEYYFVALKARGHGNAGAATGDVSASGARRRSLKRRIYDWLDSVSPPLPWAPPNRVPVISGHGIETWLTVTNHDLLFEKRMSAPLNTTVTMRDGDGRRLWRRSYRVAPGGELRVRVDEGLKSGGAPFAVGNACITSKAERPAMRGTMRPQFEILAPAGACGLHAQGDVGPGDTWFTVQSRPADERLFLVLVSTWGRAQTATISYPHEFREGGPEPQARAEIVIPANGTKLHEIRLPEAAAVRIGTAPFSVRTRCERACRVYLACASPSLDRFSIDHR